MTEQNYRYALAALKEKRGILAAEIVQLERQLRHRRESLTHVDATIRILDPTANPGAIPNKRPPRRIMLFRQGQLSRLIYDAIRGGSPSGVHISEIVTALMVASGHSSDAEPAIRARVRSNLAYLARRGKVAKVDAGKTAKWMLATE